MAALIPKASLAPGMAPAELLQPLFSQSLAAYLDARPVADPAESRRPPEIHQYHLGQALFLDTIFEAQRFRRDSAWMARNDDADHLALQYYVQGSNKVVNGNREYVQKPGNLFAVNLAYEVDALSTDAEVLTLMLPRDLVAAELPQISDAIGGLFVDNSASALVFNDHMLSLRRNLSATTTTEVASITHGTLDLLDSLIRHGDIGSSAAHDATLRTICKYIDKQLHDPELGVDSICLQFRCSRATLYRLFTPMGGVREHIQRRRLVGCFKAIVHQQHRRIYDIALDFGFVSPSHFSTLFRSYFGMTPSEARDAGQGVSGGLSGLSLMSPAASTARDYAEMMWRWGKTLSGRS